jgi:hypothetical protein
VNVRPAHAVTSLKQGNGAAGLFQPQRGRQSRKTRTHYAIVDVWHDLPLRSEVPLRGPHRPRPGAVLAGRRAHRGPPGKLRRPAFEGSGSAKNYRNCKGVGKLRGDCAHIVVSHGNMLARPLEVSGCRRPR